MSSMSASPLLVPNWHRVLTFTLFALSDTVAFPLCNSLLAEIICSFFLSFLLGVSFLLFPVEFIPLLFLSES